MVYRVTETRKNKSSGVLELVDDLVVDFEAVSTDSAVDAGMVFIRLQVVELDRKRLAPGLAAVNGFVGPEEAPVPTLAERRDRDISDDIVFMRAPIMYGSELSDLDPVPDLGVLDVVRDHASGKDPVLDVEVVAPEQSLVGDAGAKAVGHDRDLVIRKMLPDLADLLHQLLDV